MYKKIIVGLLITAIILAFPVRLFNLPVSLELILKAVKGIIYITIILFLVKRENLTNDFHSFFFKSRSVLLKLLPVFCLLILYIILNKEKLFKLDVSITNTVLGLSLVSTFILALAEEIFFRGYLYNLLKRKYSIYKSVIVSSILFAFIHIVNIFRYGDLWSIMNQMLFAMALGMLLCSVYALTKNILLVGLMHFIINIPASISNLNSTVINVTGIINETDLVENVMSTLFFIALMLPIFMLSFYYIKVVNKANQNKYP